MSIRRQWEIFGSAVLIGVFTYIFAKANVSLPPWLYGVIVAALVWGFGYNLELAKTRSSLVLEELRMIRAAIERRPDSN